MKLQEWMKILFAVVLGMTLASCGSTREKPDITGDGTSIDANDEGEDVAAMNEGDMAAVPEPERIDTSGGVQDDRFDPIHFAYDSIVIPEKDRAILNEVAHWAKGNPDRKIVISGHCDERGTLEYNRALGQRRASAVRAYLVKLGISPKRVGTVSHSEEEPVDPDHNDEAWTKNRRAEFGIVK